MFRGLYTATSAMNISETKIDVASNNMANANTAGFKKDTVIEESFPEILIHKINGDIPNRPLSREVDLEYTLSDDGDYLLASSRNGYFNIESERGEGVSSSIRMSIDDEGFIRTFSREENLDIVMSNGNYLLNSNGERIQLEEGTVLEDIEITPRGELLVDGNLEENLFKPVPPSVIGSLGSGVRLDKIESNFSQGPLEETANPLNFAIQGDGFFQIESPEGEIFYTRDGNFYLNNLGQIVTSEGDYLLGEDGPIEVGEGDLVMSETGVLFQNGEEIATLDIINIENRDFMQKYRSNYFIMNPEVEIEEADFDGIIVQGFLEGSNVDTIREMTSMIEVYRNYESNQKVVSAYDEIMQKAVNEIAG